MNITTISESEYMISLDKAFRSKSHHFTTNREVISDILDYFTHFYAISLKRDDIVKAQGCYIARANANFYRIEP